MMFVDCGYLSAGVAGNSADTGAVSRAPHLLWASTKAGGDTRLLLPGVTRAAAR